MHHVPGPSSPPRSGMPLKAPGVPLRFEGTVRSVPTAPSVYPTIFGPARSCAPIALFQPPVTVFESSGDPPFSLPPPQAQAPLPTTTTTTPPPSASGIRSSHGKRDHPCGFTFCTTKMAVPKMTVTRGRRADTRRCFRNAGRGAGGGTRIPLLIQRFALSNLGHSVRVSVPAQTPSPPVRGAARSQYTPNRRPHDGTPPPTMTGAAGGPPSVAAPQAHRGSIASVAVSHLGHFHMFPAQKRGDAGAQRPRKGTGRSRGGRRGGEARGSDGHAVRTARPARATAS